MPPKPRPRLWAAAALLALLAAGAAQAQVAPDGGAPAPLDAGLAAADGGAPDATATLLVDAGPPAESPSVTASRVATAMLATPPQTEVVPPRPSTRRLWFWMALTGAIAAGVLIGIAVHNPDHTRPDCPPDYVCPP